MQKGESARKKALILVISEYHNKDLTLLPF
jgi:hypothetical protein